MHRGLLFGTLAILTACSMLPTGQRYPATSTVAQIDIYHGTEVEDPYRWLEADVRNDTEVADWVQRECIHPQLPRHNS